MRHILHLLYLFLSIHLSGCVLYRYPKPKKFKYYDPHFSTRQTDSPIRTDGFYWYKVRARYTATGYTYGYYRFFKNGRFHLSNGYGYRTNAKEIYQRMQYKIAADRDFDYFGYYRFSGDTLFLNYIYSDVEDPLGRATWHESMGLAKGDSLAIRSEQVLKSRKSKKLIKTRVLKRRCAFYQFPTQHLPVRTDGFYWYKQPKPKHSDTYQYGYYRFLKNGRVHIKTYEGINPTPENMYQQAKECLKTDEDFDQLGYAYLRKDTLFLTYHIPRRKMIIERYKWYRSPVLVQEENLYIPTQMRVKKEKKEKSKQVLNRRCKFFRFPQEKKQ